MAAGPTGLLATTYTLFIQPLSLQFGWSRTDASWPITVVGLTLALSSPAKGFLVDRFGPRALVLPLTLLLGLFTAALALANSSTWFYWLFAAIGLLTPGNVPFGRILFGAPAAAPGAVP
jgi:MFS family permease